MASGEFSLGFTWELTWQEFYANPAALSVSVTPPGPRSHLAFFITRLELFYRRNHARGSEPWQSVTREYDPPVSTARQIDVNLYLHPAWYAQCYFRCHYQVVFEPGYGNSWADIYVSPLYASLMVDDAAPDLDVTLANAVDGGSVIPTSGGRVQWDTTLTDAVEVRWLDFYVDGAWVERVASEAYRKQDTTSLSALGLTKGAHSVRIVGTDYAMRTDEYSANFTVGNAPPTAPGGLAVGGRTSSVRVGRAQGHTVTWSAATDPNPEDAIAAYELQERPPAGEWTKLADDLTVRFYVWTPNTNGTWELRVRASDGTVWGPWTTLSPVTVVSSTAPNTPTIIEPS